MKSCLREALSEITTYSQKDLAEIVGVSHGAVSYWLRKPAMDIKLRELVKLAEATNISAVLLLRELLEEKP